MNRIKRALYNSSVSRFRFHIQWLAFVLLVYGGYLAINIGDQLPTFACVFTDYRGGSCYLMGFQHQMALPFDRLFSGRGIGVLTGLMTFFLFFILLNKAWCGFVCPLGTIQDWLSGLRKKMSVRYSTYSRSSFRKIGKIKYIFLTLLILIPMAINNSLFGLPKLNHDFAVPFCMICPGRTLLPIFQGDFSQLAIDFSSKTKMILTALGMAITGMFLAGSLYKKRFICLFCPMSAFHYIFAKAALLRINKDGSKCTRCGNCYRVCDVGIHDIADDLDNKNILKDDCMMCFKCVEMCPENDCLEVKFLGLPVYKATEEGFFTRMGRRGHGK
ncbi:MAG: 4Fe-4S binding protein [Desulfobulbaceae bacterium]|uniref:4Fe-4S binding protein n=1 Tax=Candidatus Desulfobia pelagia TaxID=2841692 RepID=A0A8J6NEP3_9BACT|nr:4Fe-4S binding protein [Candidatus Desulfobia pelagia]